MTEEMAERTLVPVAAIRAVVGDALVRAFSNYEAAEAAGDVPSKLSWAIVENQLMGLCERLGIGKPVVYEDDSVGWED